VRRALNWLASTTAQGQIALEVVDAALTDDT